MSTEARVLKSDAVRERGAVAAFNYDDYRTQCETYLAQVKQQARELLLQAHADAENLRAEAFHSAREEGFAAGLRDAENEINTRSQQLASEQTASRLRTLLPALQHAVECLQIERDQWLLRWEHSAIDVCLAIVRKLMHRNIVSSADRAAAMIRETLQLAAGSPRIRIRLNPADLEQLSELESELSAHVSAVGEAQLIADPCIEPGGCLVETQHGVIDAQLETQLQRIAEELHPGLKDS
jgi:flagellar assembly protein FliH